MQIFHRTKLLTIIRPCNCVISRLFHSFNIYVYIHNFHVIYTKVKRCCRENSLKISSWLWLSVVNFHGRYNLRVLNTHFRVFGNEHKWLTDILHDVLSYVYLVFHLCSVQACVINGGGSCTSHKSNLLDDVMREKILVSLLCISMATKYSYYWLL